MSISIEISESLQLVDHDQPQVVEQPESSYNVESNSLGLTAAEQQLEASSIVPSPSPASSINDDDDDDENFSGGQVVCATSPLKPVRTPKETKLDPSSRIFSSWVASIPPRTDADIEAIIAEGNDWTVKNAFRNSIIENRIGHVRKFLEPVRVVDVNVPSVTNRTTVLFDAARVGFTDVMLLLLDHGACVNVKSVLGFTPLYCAVIDNRVEAVKLLVERGAKILLRYKFGWGEPETILEIAVRKGYEEIATFLREAIAARSKRSKSKLPTDRAPRATGMRKTDGPVE